MGLIKIIKNKMNIVISSKNNFIIMMKKIGNIMAKHCEVCGKQTLKAAKLTFSHKQIVKRQSPNLQEIRANVNGQMKRITVCTSCLRAGKVKKAV